MKNLYYDEELDFISEAKKATDSNLPEIRLTDADSAYIRDCNENIGCGSINDDGHLYFIDKTLMKAYMLPDKYKDTPLVLYHPCGGYADGLIMVSLMGEIDLPYYHTFGDTAGMWGWIDTKGNVVIEPQYIFAMSFYRGRAIVCKGEWEVENEKYRSRNEQWGMINKKGEEIIPCKYDEIYEIENTERYVLCHKGGWGNGNNCIFDIKEGKEILDLDFDFDNGYMFNECYYTKQCICFDDHISGEEKDYIYVYSLKKKEWIYYKELYEERTLNGKSKIVVKKDGKDIVVF